MKQVWENLCICSWVAPITEPTLWPMLVTAIPDPKSIKELPSTSTSTAPSARSM